MKFDEFMIGYLKCALWASTDDKYIPLDDNYSIDDISSESLDVMMQDCARFQEENSELLSVDEQPLSMQGHDFWLTRNGHGTGYWDGGYPEAGDALTEAANAYGKYDLYVGDDGLIYGSKG